MDLNDLLTLAGLDKHDIVEPEPEIETDMSPVPEMPQDNMRKIIAIVAHPDDEDPMDDETPSCGCMGESQEDDRFSGSEDDRWGNSANGEEGPADGPEMFDDGISTLGSDSDTSLRRLIKAKGHPVDVKESVYPDYTLREMKNAFNSHIRKWSK